MIENYLKKPLFQIFKNIEDGLNSMSNYDKNIVYPNLDVQQLAQRLGTATEAACRGELKKLGISCKSGNPKNKNEDDNIIIGHPLFDHEMKLTLRKYTYKRRDIKKASWWTDRNGYDNKKRNFICIEAEYINNKIIFHNIYVSFQKFSYNDIHSNWLTETFIKENSFNIKLH